MIHRCFPEHPIHCSRRASAWAQVRSTLQSPYPLFGPASFTLLLIRAVVPAKTTGAAV